MKSLNFLFFVCLSHFSYADSNIIDSEDVFSTESLQKLYETLESSELQAHPSQLTSSISPTTAAVINDYADALVAKVESVLVERGMDTVQLPNVNLSFEHKQLLVTYSGLLNLTEGNITNIASLRRYSDVVVDYSNKYLNLDIPLSFDLININYHYKAKIMNIGPSGWVIGRASSTTFKLAVGFNFNNYTVDLNEFTVNNIGNVKLTFEGNSLIDWLLKIISNLLITLFKSTIKNVLEQNVYNVIVNVVNSLNEALQSWH